MPAASSPVLGMRRTIGHGDLRVQSLSIRTLALSRRSDDAVGGEAAARPLPTSVPPPLPTAVGHAR